MNFSEALIEIKRGRKAHRSGWNGKDMFVYHVPANIYKTQTEVAKEEFGDEVKYKAYLAIKCVDGEVATWVPSINDVLADDWLIQLND